jgi:hypothetical protein
MNVFLSHISEEASEARSLKKALESALPDVDVFVSASDIHLGDAWLKEIDEAICCAKAVLALCSPGSIRRPWLNFESGSCWAKHLPVIPVCHHGLRKDRLPDPLNIFQALELDTPDSCRLLVEQLALKLGLQPAISFDPKQMFRDIQSERPTRSEAIGIVLSHQQNQWDGGGQSLFSLANSLPAGLEGDWIFQTLADERPFLSADLHKLSGLIFPSPWRAKLEPETISATVEWVRRGGRLLLLGFELGDRHHDANLAELSHHFGIDPDADIVGPPGFGDRKPYDIPIDFDIAKGVPHPFTKGLTTIRLANVQTVRVAPGGVEWLRVGDNVVYRPRRESVLYRNGTMTTPGGTAFETNSQAGWLAAAVEAPKGLCGTGEVQMIGTWDLLGRHQVFGDDNITLMARLLDWLSGRKG